MRRTQKLFVVGALVTITLLLTAFFGGCECMFMDLDGCLF